MSNKRPFSSAIVAVLYLGFVVPNTPLAAEGLAHTVKSTILDQERTFTVHLPPSYGEQEEFSYPVLYLLDGESNANYATAVSDFLAEVGVIPEIITVALHAGRSRAQDYLPPNSGAGGGSAHRYLDHLEKEIVPYIEGRYRAAPLRLVSGHSYGGLLVIQALTQRPGLFRAHLGQSPYLDRAIGGPLLEQIEPVTTFSAEEESGKEPSRAFYYFNLGSEPNLEANFARLEATLKDATPDAGLHGVSQIEQGKSHMETRLVGHYEGLEQFFGDAWKFTFDTLAQEGAESLLSHIDRLNSEFGYKVLQSESVFQGAVQTLFSNRNATGARSIASLYVDYYPRSPVSHFLLANAQIATGAKEQALASVTAAISLFEADPDESIAPLHQAMQQLRSSLEPN